MANVPLLDIRPDHWALVRAILYAHVPQYEVWAFGSRATWQAKPYSDLDLAILSAEPLPLALSAALADAFSEADLPWRVDVLDWATTSPSFRAIVQRDKVVVQKKLTAGYDHGNAMSEWQETKLGNVIELKRGYDLPQSQRTYGNVPIVSSSGVSDFHNKAMVKAPGVVTGRYGTIGQVFYIEKDFWPLNTALYVRDFKTNDPKFISYLLKTLDFRAYSDKAAVPGVNRNHLHEAKVRIPPLPIQHAIAHILGSLDDKIELNRRMNETLEAMARALFKDWFVEFGPVRAKMEGRQPPGLSAEIAALFPDALDTEGKPVGWEMTSFAATINLIGGGTPRTAEPAYWGGEIPWFSVVDIPRDGDVFTIDTEKKITERGLSESATRLLSPGTSIISARGTVGKCALVGVPMAMNQSCYGVIGKEGRGSYFTHFSLRYLVTELQQNTHGSVFDTITQATFQTIHVPTIPIPLTQAFDHTVSSFLQRILTNLQASHTLAARRDLLLPTLLSGELRERDAEGVITGAR